jgi:uncharacterized protein (TIGR02265 family)
MTPMTAESFSLTKPLEGDFDVGACVADIPDSFVLKGMFYTRFVQQLGSDWALLQDELETPPKNGRFLAFSDYSQRDYVRIYCAVARKIYPRLGLREGVRRLARADFGVFTESTFGRVMLALVRDARSALHRVPYVYSKVAPGDWQARAEDVDERTVRIEFEPHYGMWEYQAGQFEGIVLAFGTTPDLVVERPRERCVRFDVGLR